MFKRSFVKAGLILTCLTAASRLSVAADIADAELPAGVPLNWEQSNITTLNAKRARIALDGIWQFTPAVEGNPEPPSAGWSYIKVPGTWQSARSRSRDFVAMGRGPQWDTYDGTKVARAWYQRQVAIPAEWEGRAVSLRFERVCTDAIVFVNNRECGKVPWPWGSVDITEAVTPGKTATIRVLVAAIADAEQVGTFWQNAFADVSWRNAELRSRGLTGNVFLESRSSQAYVSDIFVRTSTRKKEITLEVELTGVKQDGAVEFVANMLNQEGEVEKSCLAEKTVAAAGKQTLILSWPWANPRLWDAGIQGGAPANLYTLQLKVKGAGLDDECNQEFGFREFWIEGRQFYLNGTVLHLRQPCFYDGPRMQVGDIFSEMGDSQVDARGDRSDSTRSLDEADRKGYLVAQYVLNANKHMLNSKGRLVWDENRQQAFDRAEVWMRHYRNHPSVVMWISGFNFFNNAVDADPRHVGRRGWGENDQRWHRLMVAGHDMFEGLRKLDPTRVYYSHAGGCSGDVYTMNCYLDLLPLQEREDWLSAWAESGEMPVSMVEFGTPMDCTFRRGRHGFESNITSEPLLTEYAAIYFGNEAYSAEEPKYRQYLHDLFRGGMLYGSSENRLDDYVNNHKIQRLYRVSTWRSWRAAGLPGGLRTWSWMQDALDQVNGPTMAWIAGPKGSYPSKDHHFRAGENVQKQIVLINDTRDTQAFTVDWTATVGGKEVDRGQAQGTLAVSEIRFIPFGFSASAVEAGRTVDGDITLSATIGRNHHEDTFAFRLFGRDQPSRGRVALVDPSGLTRRMLSGLGYQTSSWGGASARLVVIGRNALKQDPSLATKLEPYVRAGGRALVFAQDPDWFARALGWRVCPKVARRVFPIPSSLKNSLLAAAASSEDLRDWTGSSTLLEPFPQYEGDYLRGNEREQPYAGWHWGNRGGVSSAPIEKLHRSGWRPLLECEFDLAYSPLMELDYGRGRLMVCTLDVEDHFEQDPAAQRVAENIVDYALHAPLSPRAESVRYVGGATGAAWLDKIGVNYERSSSLDPHTGLLLVGADARLEEGALLSFLKKGGRAFFLPQAQASGSLGTTFRPAPAAFAGSLSVPDWPEARGLSASDLRWRSHLDESAWLLGAGEDTGADGLLGRKAFGKGVAIFCQVDPEVFQADEKTYFRYTRWRATRAVAQLLANLGASFAADSQVFHPLDSSAADTDSNFVGPSGDRSGPQATGPHAGPASRATSGSNSPSRPGCYCPDYRTDFQMGDNPYRYYRW